MYRVIIVLAIAGILSSFLVGCGGKLEDTYIKTTLKDAARGDIVSPGFKYSFDTPNFIGGARNVALVREGNIIEFFVGDGLADKVRALSGKQFVVHARKYFTPYIHFMVDYIVAGSDTISVGEVAVKLPNTRVSSQFTVPEEYETVNTDKITPSLPDLRAIEDKKFKVQSAGVSFDDIGGVSNYTLNLKNVRFFIQEENDAILAIMDAIRSEGKTFEGGVHYVSSPTSLARDLRERNRFGGNVKIGYVIYGGNACVVSM